MKYFTKFNAKEDMWEIYEMGKKPKLMMSVSERIMDLKLLAWLIEQQAIIPKFRKDKE